MRKYYKIGKDKLTLATYNVIKQTKLAAVAHGEISVTAKVEAVLNKHNHIKKVAVGL